MGESKFLILVVIGFIAGWLVSIVVFAEEKNLIRKLIVAIIAGIFGAYIGTTTVGETFLISSFKILGETFISLAKCSSRIMICGVVFIPTFFSALGIALAVSLFIKVFRSRN